LMKSSRMDIIVLLTTFFLTVFFDLILAIEVGMILSSFIFMKRMSEATTIKNMQDIFGLAEQNAEKIFEEELSNIPKDTMLYEINGPLFFGASQKFQEFLTDLNQAPKVLIIRMRHVPFIDATGINSLKQFYQRLKPSGTIIIISGANSQLKEAFFKSGLHTMIDKNNILNNIDEAILRAEQILKR